MQNYSVLLALLALLLALKYEISALEDFYFIFSERGRDKAQSCRRVPTLA